MVGDARALGLRLGGDSRTASFRLGRLCQRDDAAVSEGALSQFWSPPFTFLSGPLSPFFHPRSKAPSPVITKKRPHESQHSSHLSAIRRKITRRSPISRGAFKMLHCTVPDIPPSHFTPTSISVPRAHLAILPAAIVQLTAVRGLPAFQPPTPQPTIPSIAQARSLSLAQQQRPSGAHRPAWCWLT